LNNRLKSKIVVQAIIKLADKNSIPISVIKKGDNERGMIIMRAIKSDQKSFFYRYNFNDNRSPWELAGKNNLVIKSEADKFIAKEIKIDTDIWVLEIEDFMEDNEIIKLFYFNLI